MARLIKTSTMALVIAAILGNVLGAVPNARADAAGAGWTIGWDDGCGYYHDGYGSYTLRACARMESASVTWLDFYVPANGQWVYGEAGMAWIDGMGTVIYYGGYFYYGIISAPVTATVDLSTSMSLGGGDSNISDPFIFATGGTPYRPWVTYNPVVDQLWGAANSGVIGGWTPPTCRYWDHNICVY